MIFRETILKGTFIIEPERKEDARGFFARTWSAEEFSERGLNPRILQCGASYNSKRGTLRGMHYQAPPHEEVKLVRCTRGAVFDVVIDLRPDSSTYAKHTSVVLTEANGLLLYIPEGLAHGYQTLEDDTEVFYQISQTFHPESARGVRWDDPCFGIRWPDADRIILPRDRQFPSFVPEWEPKGGR